MNTENICDLAKYQLKVIRCARNCYFKVTIRFTLKAGGVPPTFADSIFKMEVRKANTNAVILTFANGNGLEKTEGGLLVLTKSATQMLVPAGEYVYDLMQTTDGKPKPRLGNKFIIIKNTTDNG